jgi:UDP-N-acetylmuramoyl-tripeptide--D-alanyl-D-alanine ligase
MNARSEPLWTSEEVARETGGRTAGSWQATGVSIDSRSLAPGDLFIAIKGPRVDGHDYVRQALERSAAAAVVSRVPPGCERGPLVVVADTQTALEALGRAARTRVKAKVIAVTGSVGKTGTKEALKLVLERQGKTAASVGSLNNLWGVPLSLARMPRDATFGVFELGMNHPGELAPLSRQVQPDVAIITTIAAAHKEFFETVMDIAEAKAEIFAGMRGGVAVLNRDNPFFPVLLVAAYAAGIERVISFGAHPEAQARLASCKLGATGSEIVARIDGRELHYRLGVPGRHWAINSLAVLSGVLAVGADVERAAAALADLAAPKGRGQRHRIAIRGGGFELIDDSYNASPTSMRAAFEVLAAAEPGQGGRRIAALGDMLELGTEAAQLHASLADPLRAAGVDLVFTAGPLMAALDAALPAALRGGHTENSEELARLVVAAVRPGDVITVKGSLGSRMGKVVEALCGLDDLPRAVNG